MSSTWWTCGWRTTARRCPGYAPSVVLSRGWQLCQSKGSGGSRDAAVATVKLQQGRRRRRQHWKRQLRIAVAATPNTAAVEVVAAVAAMP